MFKYNIILIVLILYSGARATFKKMLAPDNHEQYRKKWRKMTQTEFI